MIVSPYFPPSTLAGVHRARHLARHLPSAGWTPIVLCVDEQFHEQHLDPGLAALVPGDVEIVKTRAHSAALTRTIGLGDIGLRGWSQIRNTLFELLASRRIDAVLITGSPFYPMLLAPAIKRRFPTPVVLDFQDPWVSAWGGAQPALSKAGMAHRLATALEPRALRGADFVTSVSDTQNEEMAARYPWLDVSRMAGIPIGGDPDDFAALRAQEAELADDLEPGCVNLSYVGTFLPRSSDLVCVLLRAFKRLRAAEPLLAQRIRLNFLGTSNQPNDRTTFRVRPLAEAEGVAEAVREIPQRLPYLRALAALARSQGILLIGSDEPHYTASKIYPALMSGRPFLSLFHRASSAHAILSSTGGGAALAFETADELCALEAPLTEVLRTLSTSPQTLGRADPKAYAQYGACNIARRFGSVFDSLAASPAEQQHGACNR